MTNNNCTCPQCMPPPANQQNCNTQCNTNPCKGQKGEPGCHGMNGSSGSKGDTGPKGDKGSIGPPGPNSGFTGPKGDKGTKGEVGSQGIQGIQGQVGIQGVQGIQGPIGLKGPIGPIGNTGTKGDIGQKGEIGLTGLQGSTGSDGVQGATGSQGIQGIQGIKGDKGLQGIQGIQGIPGPQGPQGIKGSIGIKGPSGDSGIKGSKGDIGVTGNAGPTGQKGDAGPQGVIGPQGIQGIKGSVGSQGVQGSQGQPGIAGTTGVKGQKGEIGATGSAGTAGSTGAVGTKGQKGEVGVTGAAGPTGTAGATGAAGAAGTKGQKGEVGVTGAAGPTGTAGATGSAGATGATGTKGQKGEKGPQEYYVPMNFGGFTKINKWENNTSTEKYLVDESIWLDAHTAHRSGVGISLARNINEEDLYQSTRLYSSESTLHVPYIFPAYNLLVIDGVNITARAFMRPNAVPDNNASFNPSQQYYQLEWSPKDKVQLTFYAYSDLEYTNNVPTDADVRVLTNNEAPAPKKTIMTCLNTPDFMEVGCSIPITSTTTAPKMLSIRCDFIAGVDTNDGIAKTLAGLTNLNPPQGSTLNKSVYISIDVAIRARVLHSNTSTLVSYPSLLNKTISSTNPYGVHDIRKYMWNQDRLGDIGYVRIKVKGTNDYVFALENPTSTSLDYHKLYAASSNVFNEPSVSFSDNLKRPDEHIWKIKCLPGTNRFLLQNTAFPSVHILDRFTHGGTLSGEEPRVIFWQNTGSTNLNEWQINVFNNSTSFGTLYAYDYQNSGYKVFDTLNNVHQNNTTVFRYFWMVLEFIDNIVNFSLTSSNISISTQTVTAIQQSLATFINSLGSYNLPPNSIDINLLSGTTTSTLNITVLTTDAYNMKTALEQQTVQTIDAAISAVTITNISSVTVSV